VAKKREGLKGREENQTTGQREREGPLSLRPEKHTLNSKVKGEKERKNGKLGREKLQN